MSKFCYSGIIHSDVAIVEFYVQQWDCHACIQLICPLVHPFRVSSSVQGLIAGADRYLATFAGSIGSQAGFLKYLLVGAPLVKRQRKHVQYL